jgi:hypothetical protein
MQFDYQFSFKDLKRTKVLVHILTGRLKIGDIKRLFKNVERLHAIKDNNFFELDDIIPLTKIDFVFLIKFVNEYTKYQRITNEFLVQYFVDILQRVRYEDIDLGKILKPLIYTLQVMVVR